MYVCIKTDVIKFLERQSGFSSIHARSNHLLGLERSIYLRHYLANLIKHYGYGHQIHAPAGYQCDIQFDNELRAAEGDIYPFSRPPLLPFDDLFTRLYREQ